MSDSTVFVTQETTHDFSKAEQFGDVVFLTRDDLNNLKGSLHNEAVIGNIRAKLLKFDESKDWVVVTGSPYVTAAVFAILGARRVRKVQILRWDNRDFRYLPMYLELERTNGG